jgi:YfiH family protein
MLTHEPWTALADLRHAFLDRAECATVGWRTAVAAAGAPLPIVTARQVHGTRIVTACSQETEPPQADGVVTADAGFLVGVVTADCMPVLLLSRARRVVAAVHAGWRGTAAGVLEAAVTHLAGFGAGPETLEAVIGPAIGPCCYEVGDEVRAAFEARSGQVTAPAWTLRGRRQHLDLRAAASLLLAAEGVPTAAALGPCTACGTGYSSYRRDGAGGGRQLSFIGWARQGSQR